MKEKLNISEIVPSHDALQEEMEDIKGGKFHLCLSGCHSGGGGAKELQKSKTDVQ